MSSLTMSNTTATTNPATEGSQTAKKPRYQDDGKIFSNIFKGSPVRPKKEDSRLRLLESEPNTPRCDGEKENESYSVTNNLENVAVKQTTALDNGSNGNYYLNSNSSSAILKPSLSSPKCTGSSSESASSSSTSFIISPSPSTPGVVDPSSLSQLSASELLPSHSTVSVTNPVIPFTCNSIGNDKNISDSHLDTAQFNGSQKKLNLPNGLTTNCKTTNQFKSDAQNVDQTKSQRRGKTLEEVSVKCRSRKSHQHCAHSLKAIKTARYILQFLVINDRMFYINGVHIAEFHKKLTFVVIHISAKN